jgi:hypothetical protein
MSLNIERPEIRKALAAAFAAILVGVGCAGGTGGMADLLAGAAGGSRVVAGLKDALSVGTQNAVAQTSQLGGYLENPVIRIELPDALDAMAKGLRMVGYGGKVDELYVAMNRAAERSAAEAADVFLLGIRQMTFSDAMGILNGGDTAATEYFERTTRGTLYRRFEPIVSEKMGQVGVVQQYDELLARFAAIPLVDKPNLDIRNYVTNQALDGLFSVLGNEERKIRTDPAARVTPLLREVFGDS